MGALRSLEGEKAIIVGRLCRKFSVAVVRAQCISLHRRLEVMWTGLHEALAHRATTSQGVQNEAGKYHLPADHK